jgi:hypothetical protein
MAERAATLPKDLLRSLGNAVLHCLDFVKYAIDGSKSDFHVQSFRYHHAIVADSHL